jgi:nitrous oxidase accessory protein
VKRLLSLRFAMLVIGVAIAPPSSAETIVPARAGALVAALRAAGDGDTIVLARGVHRDRVRIERRLVMRGMPGAVLEGDGTGTLLTIAAGGVTLEDLALRGSGRRVLTIDAAVQVLSAMSVTIRRLAIRDCLYGIYAERADRLVVEDCRMIGRVPPMQEDGEGNGIHLWYTRDAELRRNDVSRYQDSIYLSFADRTRVTDNLLHDAGRYGLHTMYCQDNHLTGNRFTRNVAGCAIMFSNHLQVIANDFDRNRGPRTYGLLLKDCSGGTFRNNRLVDNTIAVFMDNSNRNRIEGNLLQDNGWGLLMFSSCAGNVITGNAFINDDYPVALDMRRTSNQFDDGQRGNYWSNHAPYDLDDDGYGDVPHSPVGAFAFLSKQYPDLSVLANSPAVAALGVTERVIPALRPSEAVDHHPLLMPPPVRGTGRPLENADPRGSTVAAAGFGVLALLGLGGMAGGRRSR